MYYDVEPSVLLERMLLPKVKQTYECKYCKNVYATFWTLTRHEKSCNANAKTNESNCSTLEIMAQIDKMSKMIEMLSLKETHVTNNVDNSVNIQINSFGSERTDYLAKNTKFLTECVQMRELGIPMILEKLHFHPKVPSNHNIRLRNNMLQTYNGTEWKYMAKKPTMDRLILNAVDIYQEHFENNEAELYEYMYKSECDVFNAKLDDHRNGQGTLDKVPEEVEAMLMNSSVKIHGTCF